MRERADEDDKYQRLLSELAEYGSPPKLGSLSIIGNHCLGGLSDLLGEPTMGWQTVS